jgi:hypothetical protein
MTESKKTLKRRLREADIKRHNEAYATKTTIDAIKEGALSALNEVLGKPKPANVVLDVKRLERVARSHPDVAAGKVNVDDKFRELLQQNLT